MTVFVKRAISQNMARLPGTKPETGALSRELAQIFS